MERWLGIESRQGRREFLRRAGGVGLGLAGGVGSHGWAAEEKSAAALVAGKDKRLIVLEAKPIVLETPLTLLREHHVTPIDVLFVRNNQGLPGSATTEPPRPEPWTVAVDGLVEYPRSIALAELSRMPQTEVELVLQCSGNGRSLFSAAAPTKGGQWGRGGIGNVRFAGVPLRQLLDKLKVNVAPSARFLTIDGKEGPESPTEADFQHSIPLGEALQKAVVALRLNGKPIPAVHGGPVRLVMPGYYGTMHVKWLSRLTLDAHETANHNQVPRYRLPLVPIKPGTPFTATFANSRPNWHLKINSMIFYPLPADKPKAGRVEVRGVAWNDGVASLEAVEVSTDEGRTWQRAELDTAAGPYAWRQWKRAVELPAGKQTIWSRAVDALGRTQPLDGSVYWNPSGYEWNGVDKVTVAVA